MSGFLVPCVMDLIVTLLRGSKDRRGSEELDGLSGGEPDHGEAGDRGRLGAWSQRRWLARGGGAGG